MLQRQPAYAFSDTGELERDSNVSHRELRQWSTPSRYCQPKDCNMIPGANSLSFDDHAYAWASGDDVKRVFSKSFSCSRGREVYLLGSPARIYLPIKFFSEGSITAYISGW